MEFLKELHRRNKVFFYFGLIFSFLSFVFLVGYVLCDYALFEICHWIKPGKFAFSFATLFFTLGWYMEYLKEVLGKKNIQTLSWIISCFIVVEMCLMLAEGWIDSDSFYKPDFSPEALQSISRNLFLITNTLIITSTIIISYIGLQFFKPLSLKPVSYLWSIRAGYAIFILSSVLGSLILQHYGQVSPDPNTLNLPFTQFASKRDLLISIHFLGIHYLQLLPLCCYLFHNQLQKKFILSSIGVYLATFLLIIVY
jgi:hypothetical protein